VPEIAPQRRGLGFARGELDDRGGVEMDGHVTARRA
jgi:hypothetical protein